MIVWNETRDWGSGFCNGEGDGWIVWEEMRDWGRGGWNNNRICKWGWEIGDLRCAFRDYLALASDLAEVNLLLLVDATLNLIVRHTFPLFEYLIQLMRNLKCSSLEAGAMRSKYWLVVRWSWLGVLFETEGLKIDRLRRKLDGSGQSASFSRL